MGILYNVDATVAKVLAQVFSEGLFKREDLFITTKVWPTDYSRVVEAVQESLKKIQVDHFDHILVHMPHSDIPAGQKYPVKLPMHRVWA